MLFDYNISFFSKEHSHPLKLNLIFAEWIVLSKTSGRMKKKGFTHIDSVSVSSVEWVPILVVEVWEQLLNVPKAGDLEFFRFLDDHLPVEGIYQRCWVKKQWTV